jgi:hypothetical protein
LLGDATAAGAVVIVVLVLSSLEAWACWVMLLLVVRW